MNIARKAAAFAPQPPMEIPFDLSGMWEKTQSMLRDSLDALVNLDPGLANDVCARDDEVDRMKREIRLGAEEMIAPRPAQVPVAADAAGRLAQPGADRRPRHEHRRGRDLHGRGPDHPPRGTRLNGTAIGPRETRVI